MRSTGEVLGLADSFGLAFFKSQEATKQPLPIEGTVLISVAEKNPLLIQIAKGFQQLGFKITATKGTKEFLEQHGIEAQFINKLHEGRPNIVDQIMNGEIQLVINTPIGKKEQHDDSYIRKTAIRFKIPYITTLTAALATTKGITAYKEQSQGVKALQQYHNDIH